MAVKLQKTSRRQSFPAVVVKRAERRPSSSPRAKTAITRAGRTTTKRPCRRGNRFEGKLATMRIGRRHRSAAVWPTPNTTDRTPCRPSSLWRASSARGLARSGPRRRSATHVSSRWASRRARRRYWTWSARPQPRPPCTRPSPPRTRVRRGHRPRDDGGALGATSATTSAPAARPSARKRAGICARPSFLTSGRFPRPSRSSRRAEVPARRALEPAPACTSRSSSGRGSSSRRRPTCSSPASGPSLKALPADRVASRTSLVAHPCAFLAPFHNVKSRGLVRRRRACRTAIC